MSKVPITARGAELLRGEVQRLKRVERPAVVQAIAEALQEAGVPCRAVNKVREGRPHIVDMIKNNEISLIVNTTENRQAIRESHSIRREAVHRKVTYYTTIAAAKATCVALDHLDATDVNRLQDLHEELAG